MMIKYNRYMEPLLRLDEQITYFIYSVLPHNQILDVFFSFLSLQGSSVIIWLIPLIYVFYVEQHEDKRFAFFFLTNLAVTYMTSDILLKNIVQRLRPDSLMIVSNICPPTYSFPSSHAALAFAAAGMLGEFDKKRRVFYYIVALLVAGSRIYLQCHYVLDIIAGALIGMVISYGLLQMHKGTFSPVFSKKKKKG